MRMYRDKWGVVHEASDHGTQNRITLCERLIEGDYYVSDELMPVGQTFVTCLLCHAAPAWFQRLHGIA